MKKAASTRPVTVRFSLGEYQRLLDEAENSSGNVADVIRLAWAEYQKLQKQEDLLLRLEQRLTYSVFELLVTMTKADEEKKSEIRAKLNERGIQW